MDLGILKEIFNYGNLVHAISGAAGGVTAMVVLYPLETARLRLQVDDKRQAKSSPIVVKEILKEEGVKGIYRGINSVLSTICISSFVYFYTYNAMKAVILRSRKPEPMIDLVVAFSAACVNVLVTNPLWVANTRLKLQGAKLKTEEYEKQQKKGDKYSGTLDCIFKIWRNEGTAVLWSGTMASLVLASNPAVQFMTYEVQKRYMQYFLNQVELHGAVYFIMGAIAKIAATFVTYPMQIVQSKQRVGFGDQKGQQRNFFQALLDLLKTSGFKGLYRGLEAKLTQTVLNAALMFLTYEKIAHFIFRLMGMPIKS